MEEQTINRIAEILGQSGGAVVSEYMIWFIASAVAWIVASAIGIRYTLKWKPPADFDLIEAIPFIKGVLVFVFALVILCHIPDLAAPRAIAVHQLLIDIRG